MSILSNIFHKVLGGVEHAASNAVSEITGRQETAPAAAAPAAAAEAPAPQAAATPAQPVDVEAVMTQLAARKGQNLDWRHSIVDMLKVLDLDSSLEARRQLAHELNYSGDTSDTAKMNMWLHAQVMQKLAENGGKVPESLKTPQAA